jgi:hypothetical protein
MSHGIFFPGLVMLFMISMFFWVFFNIVFRVFRGIFGVFKMILTGNSDSVNRNNSRMYSMPRGGTAPGGPGYDGRQNPQSFQEPVIYCQAPECGHENPRGARFCRACGHAFPVQMHY